MDEAERTLLARGLRHACAQAGPALDAALEGLGWPEALVADGRTAVSVLFELQGETNTNSSALGWVLGSALGPTAGPRGHWLLPPLGHGEVPAAVTDGRLTARGLLAAPPDDGNAVLAVAAADQDHLVVEVQSAHLVCRTVRGMDPRLGLVEVTADGTPFVVHGQLGPGQWSAGVARARLAVAHQLVGAARTMLERARTHALERTQFGRPIGQFQAVRHRLADTLVAIEAADAALDAAWLGDDLRSVDMAKALAGRGARTAARHSQQVLAGIGFTTEHDLHDYVRRTLVLDQLLGAARTLTSHLGHHILSTGTLPTWLPL